MQTDIVTAGGFRLSAKLTRVELPGDQYSLSFATTWAEAKDPSDPRQVFQLTSDRQGLQALRDLLDHALADGKDAAR